MKSEPSNISIRVRLQDEAPSDMVADEHVIILWDRIIAAVLLVALLAGLLLVAVQYWRASEVPAAMVPAVSSTTHRADASAVEIERDLSSAVVTDDVQSISQPNEGLAPVPSEHLVISEQSIDVSQVDQTEIDEAVGLSAPELASVKLYSQEVLNAQLTTEMDNRRPIGEAPAQLFVSPEQLLTVYFYIEIVNHRAEPVYFNWYRNNKRMAKVPIRPRHQHTKTFSSKYIDTYMVGDWRVELTNQTGELLAVSRFKVDVRD